MSDLFCSVKMAEMPPVWERAADSDFLWVGMCLSIFPFDVWDNLRVQFLFRSIPEVSLLV